MHSIIINFVYFLYSYGWVIFEILFLLFLIWLVMRVKKMAYSYVYISLFLFLVSGIFVIFHNDYIAGKLGEIIFLLLAVSSVTLFTNERKK